MAKLTVVVCDKCKSVDRATKRFSVRCESNTAAVDLCDEHAKVLEEILSSFGKGHAARGFAGKVRTIEEIETEKLVARPRRDGRAPRQGDGEPHPASTGRATPPTALEAALSALSRSAPVRR